MVEVNKENREVEVRKTYCDICNKHFYNSLDHGATLEVQSEESYTYPECGYSKNYIYDICGDCVRDKLFPFIREEAQKEPRIEEYDW